MLTHRATSRVSIPIDLSLQIGCISKQRKMFCTIAPGRAKLSKEGTKGSAQPVKRPSSASRVLLNECLAVVGESELYFVSSHVVLNPARSGHSSLADLPLSIPPQSDSYQTREKELGRNKQRNCCLPTHHNAPDIHQRHTKRLKRSHAPAITLAQAARRAKHNTATREVHAERRTCCASVSTARRCGYAVVRLDPSDERLLLNTCYTREEGESGHLLLAQKTRHCWLRPLRQSSEQRGHHVLVTAKQPPINQCVAPTARVRCMQYADTSLVIAADGLYKRDVFRKCSSKADPKSLWLTCCRLS